MTPRRKFKGLTGSKLKLIALIAMTCDHVGKILFPEQIWLQVIGRLAFPIFAYMISEGCAHTRNRAKYLLTMTGFAAVCQIVYFVALGSLYQCIFVTFALSIAMIYLIDNAKKKGTAPSWLLAVFSLIILLFVSVLLPRLLRGTDFRLDYGFLGAVIPVLVYLPKGGIMKIFSLSLGLVLLALWVGTIQWYALAAIIPLAMYNGKPGKIRLKYAFYVYYPLHLALIYLIA